MSNWRHLTLKPVVFFAALALAVASATPEIRGQSFEPGLYVGNDGDSSISRVDASGTGVTIHSTPGAFGGGGVFRMTGLAFDPLNEFLYFARPAGPFGGDGDGRIWRLDSLGNVELFAEQRHDGSFLNAFGFAFSPAGELHALLLGPTQIVRFNEAGVPILVHDTGAGGQTIGFAISPGGEFFWSDVGAKVVYRATSSTTSEIIADASDGLESPTGLAFDSSGRLYVADFAPSSRVFRFDGPHNGSVIADGSVGAFAPVAVVVDRDDNVFVANSCSGQQSTIIKLNTDGIPIGPQLFADANDGLSCSRSLALPSLPFLPPLPEPPAGVPAPSGAGAPAGTPIPPGAGPP